MSLPRPMISVIGTGYLGATHAAGFAELGYDVIGIDNDADKIEALAEGRVPFHEPGLPELLAGHCASGRLKFSTDLADAAAADVHFVCVGTPQGPSGAADLTALHSVVDALVPLLTRTSLIVGKSTVPVGTAEELAERIGRLKPLGVDVELAWNPEFLREGFALEDTLHPNRLVFGVTSPAAEWTLRGLYARTIADDETPVVVTDLPTAELAKVAANAFLATKISFINAMAELCEATGADVVDLADVLGHDVRIGRRFLGAGLGFGGGCLPKDIRALQARGAELGHSEAVAFLGEVDAINLRRRDRIIDMAAACVGSFQGVKIAVLGAAFKPDSDDVRDSPALDVANRLQAAGAFVTVHDPAANLTARQQAPALRFAANALTACRKADLVLHLTEWSDFAALDPAAVRAVVRRPVLIDGRNALDRRRWVDAGWEMHAPGRPVLRPAAARNGSPRGAEVAEVR